MTTDNDGKVFQLLAVLPLEISHRILKDFATGKDLSTFALACGGSKEPHNEKLLAEIVNVGQERLQSLADFIETKSAEANHGKVNALVTKAVTWIRSIQQIHNTDLKQQESSPKTRIRHFSENMALVDFLQESITKYSRPDLGEFEWPLWTGLISVEGSRRGTRLRNTARVVLTAPMQRPSFIPGSGLLKNQTPSSRFCGELYNMVPGMSLFAKKGVTLSRKCIARFSATRVVYNYLAVPPWGCLRPFSNEDECILRPVVERLQANNHVAVPSGFHHVGDILDVRIITSQQAERLLSSRSWRPRTDWILQSASLICCWQDDSADLSNDREYLPYIIDMLKASKRMELVQACCREYQP